MMWIVDDMKAGFMDFTSVNEGWYYLYALVVDLRVRYIGVGVGDSRTRPSTHDRRGNFGFDDNKCVWMVVFRSHDKETIYAREKSLIGTLGRTKLGFGDLINHEAGGSGINKATPKPIELRVILDNNYIVSYHDSGAAAARYLNVEGVSMETAKRKINAVGAVDDDNEIGYIGSEDNPNRITIQASRL